MDRFKDEHSATAKLDSYLARHYPHLFSTDDLSPPVVPKSSENFVNSDRHPLTSTLLPSCASRKRVFSPKAPHLVSLETNLDDDYEPLSACSSHRLTSDNDDCEKFLDDDSVMSFSSESDQQIVDKKFSLASHASFLGRKSMPRKESIESKVEEFLSEYRDGLESPWFRTPDQSKLFDLELSDPAETPANFSGSESPDILEAVWRRRRRSKIKDENRRQRRCSSS